MGDAHERSGDGFKSVKQGDSVVDLLNNYWGRKVGRELLYQGYDKESLSDPVQLSSFLNNIVERMSEVIPEMQGLNFTPKQQGVQNLAKDIGRANLIDVPE